MSGYKPFLALTVPSTERRNSRSLSPRRPRRSRAAGPGVPAGPALWGRRPAHQPPTGTPPGAYLAGEAGGQLLGSGPWAGHRPPSRVKGQTCDEVGGPRHVHRARRSGNHCRVSEQRRLRGTREPVTPAVACRGPRPAPAAPSARGRRPRRGQGPSRPLPSAGTRHPHEAADRDRPRPQPGAPRARLSGRAPRRRPRWAPRGRAPLLSATDDAGATRRQPHLQRLWGQVRVAGPARPRAPAPPAGVVRPQPARGQAVGHPRCPHRPSVPAPPARPTPVPGRARPLRSPRPPEQPPRAAAGKGRSSARRAFYRPYGALRGSHRAAARRRPPPRPLAVPPGLAGAGTRGSGGGRRAGGGRWGRRGPAEGEPGGEPPHPWLVLLIRA